MTEGTKAYGESVSINMGVVGEKTMPKKKGKKIGKFVFLLGLESVVFGCGVAVFIMSLTIDRLQKTVFWDLGLWKLCVLFFTIVSGRLISQLFTMLILFLIWRFWVNERALYFGYGVRKSVVFFIWVGQVALAWGLIVDHRNSSTDDDDDIVNDVTRGLSGGVIGAFLWLIKTCLVMLVGSIHATKLLDKTKEAVYLRNTLVSLLQMDRKNISNDININGSEHDHDHHSNIEEYFDSVETKVFDKLFQWDKHDKDRISRRVIRKWLNAIRSEKMIPLPHVDENGINGNDKKLPGEAGKEIAAHIFAQFNPHNSNRCISLQEILKFVGDEKVANQLKGLADTKLTEKEHDEPIERSHQHIGIASEDPKIERSVFQDWMVEIYMEYDSLNSTLNHRKTAIDELNVIASVIILLIIMLMWVLFMGFLTTKVIVFLSSQLVLAAFIFGNSVKNVFEAVIFVFLVHPFDVGDRCVINGIQMVVEEMNISTTTFLRYDNEKIYYPNSLLASKPISNLYRSPPMSESIEFAISLHTPNHVIEKLQEFIKTYLEMNPRLWRPDHSLQFKEIEDVNKMKLALILNHTINFHYMGKRMTRKSELVLHMKNLFEELKIEYNLLPQQVQMMGSVRSQAASTF